VALLVLLLEVTASGGATATPSPPLMRLSRALADLRQVPRSFFFFFFFVLVEADTVALRPSKGSEFTTLLLLLLPLLLLTVLW
jgi:hypothetical protein